jgi:zona occludens toxin (predicted ATPase)
MDGSFVTSVDAPNDIDMILVLDETHDFAAGLRPFEYNVVSKADVRRRYNFDIVAVAAKTSRMAEAIEFFSRIRNRPNDRKGILEVRL